MSKDIIMLMTTDANLPKFPWGFDSTAVVALQDVNGYIAAKREREEKINAYINAIRSDSKWLENVRLKANERNIPLDSMLRLDAIYMVENEGK